MRERQNDADALADGNTDTNAGTDTSAICSGAFGPVRDR
jgi:hypothetical protein